MNMNFHTAEKYARSTVPESKRNCVTENIWQLLLWSGQGTVLWNNGGKNDQQQLICTLNIYKKKKKVKILQKASSNKNDTKYRGSTGAWGMES